MEGYWGQLIEHLNTSGDPIVSVDIPSGLFADQASEGAIIEAQYTFSFELPKLAFFFPQNHRYVGRWIFGSIGLLPDFLEEITTHHHFADRNLAQSMLKERHKYDHKGTHGHALLVAGSHGKMGAAILAARAVLRSGAGLLTVHVPRCAYSILQTSVPEAMVSVDVHDTLFSEVPDTSPYQAIGIGCGMGTNEISFQGLTQLMVNSHQPMVIDADALNIMSRHPALFSAIPPGSILTPHPKEFERLFGKSEDEFARNACKGKKHMTCIVSLSSKELIPALPAPMAIAILIRPATRGWPRLAAEMY